MILQPGKNRTWYRGTPFIRSVLEAGAAIGSGLGPRVLIPMPTRYQPKLRTYPTFNILWLNKNKNLFLCRVVVVRLHKLIVRFLRTKAEDWG